MEDYDYFLKKVSDFHGHTCTGIALGTRMTLAAMRYLELDPYQKSRDIIAYAEIDRCIADAVLVITGCSLGKRSLKHVDYGKFAVTLVNQKTGKAVRATVKEAFSGEGDIEETVKKIAAIPDAELVTLQEVKVSIPVEDLPGHPVKTAICSQCGERIMDGRDVRRQGADFCRRCAGGAYYTEAKG